MYVLKKKRPNRSQSAKPKKKKLLTKKQTENLEHDSNGRINLENDCRETEFESSFITNIKVFYFIINFKTFLQHQITIDITKFPKIQDLQNEIAFTIKTNPINIIIKDFNPDDDLQKIPDNFIFHISITNVTKDIKFDILNDQIITIING